jgi:transcriptional regulator with GAF, ATPase, and Fis domain
MQQTSDSAYLIVQLGDRWTDVLRLNVNQKVTIGRSSDCQIVVRDERVSRHHASISYSAKGWLVQDLGSRNGTQVAGAAIEGKHLLTDGSRIVVGGCQMLFTHNLASGSSLRGHSQRLAGSGREGSGLALPLEHRNTQEIDPTIVGRLERSQWSWGGRSGAAAAPGRTGPPDVTSPADSLHGYIPPSSSAQEGWSFFHRLVFELVQCKTPEAAAQGALDQLLGRLGISSGGVVVLEADGGALTPGGDGAGEEAEIPALSVLAARQGTASSYRRVSDFLVRSVIADRQAVLARNVQDDSTLGLAQASGQREIISIICAPLRDPNSGSRVLGLVHVYTLGDERMLSEDDLAVAVGVADHLTICLARLQAEQRLEQDLQQTRRKLDALEERLQADMEMVGTSRAIRGVQQAIQRAAPTNATVLIRGESGVGKELVARAVHRLSQRSQGPFVCLNCAALAPTLLESELFGHEKGAFTGATDRKIGKFEAADGGTLFLDEIGEMSPELQAKFLRVLEGQTFERVGGGKAIHTNVRVIAATNRNLEEAVADKQFRADLYFRLRVVEVVVPPLRERLEDVPALVEHFIQAFKQHAGRRLAGVESRAWDVLCHYHWPGNIRELRNVIERAVVLGASSTIDIDDLSLSPLSQKPGDDTSVAAGGGQPSAFEPLSLAELERRHIAAMLEHVGGNKSRAAQLLGIERSTLDRKLKRLQ